MKRFLLSIVCLASSLSLMAQQRVTINPDVEYQRIEFFGAADAWSGNFVGKYWGEVPKRQIADYLFSQEMDAAGNPVGIGLSIWRVNLGAGTLEQPGADIYPYQRRAESYMSLDGKSYDWSKCAGNEYFMQAAKERGCNEFILFSNSPLVQYTINGKGYAPSADKANLREEGYDAYAKYLVDVTEHLMDKGYNIPYISPINEPQVNWDGPRQEGSPWRNSEIYRMACSLDKALEGSPKMDGVRMFIAETSLLKALYENPAYLVKQFKGDEAQTPGRQLYNFFDEKSPYYLGDLKHLDREFTAHPYHNHYSSEELREVHRNAAAEAEKYGLDYHSSEWCLLPSAKRYGGITEDWQSANHADIQAALMMARLIHSDFVDVNAVSWCYWKAMELRGDHALVALHATDGDIHKGGYVTANKMLWVLGNYSRFVRPNYKRIALDGADDLDTLAATAFISPDGKQIVAVFVNSAFENKSVDITLPKSWSKRVKSVRSYRTDARHDLTFAKESNSLSYEVAQRGVTTFVIDL
ncbi:MAG: xylanase [Alistipes sp.]|nr:xylanase [Alistipes sp.]